MTEEKTKTIEQKWKERQAFEEANPKRYKMDHLEAFLGVECPDTII